MSLLDDCRARAKVRGVTYPPGYGFALTYLDDTLNPAHLRDGACACVGYAYGPEGSAADRKAGDLVAFVNAYAAAERFEDYAIEAAQVCLAFAMGGHPFAARVMALCGHPGYDMPEGEAA